MSAAGSATLVPSLLVSIARERKTGVLEIEAEGTTTLLYFQDGAMVFAEAGTLGETLGRVLVRQGKLTMEQYAAVIERMTAALVDNEQVRFGEAAVALGYLTGADVNDALALQVRQKALRCFQWTRAECRFDDTPGVLEGIAPYPTAVESLVIEGVFRFFDAARVDAVLSDIEHRYARLSVSPEELGRRFGLSPLHQRFLLALDGQATLEQAALGPGLDPLGARQLLAAMVILEALELRDGRDTARPSLPPPTRPGVRTMRVRADQVARRLRAAMARGTAGPAAEAAKEPVEAAAKPAAKPAAPAVDPQVEAQRALLEAEQAFQAGLRHARKHAWGLASEELGRAHQRAPALPLYGLHAAWARLMTAPTPEARELLRPEVEEASKRALREDGELAFGWYVQGRLAMDVDDLDKAEKCFRRSVRFDDRDLEAAQWLRLTSARREKKKR